MGSEHKKITDLNLYNDVLILSGNWTVFEAAEKQSRILQCVEHQKIKCVDLSCIKKFDSAGALILVNAIKSQDMPKIIGDEGHIKLFNDILLRSQKPTQEIEEEGIVSLFEYVGRRTHEIASTFQEILQYLGHIAVLWVSTISPQRELRWSAISAHIVNVGVKALPIVGLISFLIGMVLAYQGINQLAKFGAEIYAIDFLSVSVIREIGVLLTSIVIAGRSGSAFTAQIGTMVLNEEVDALSMIGLKPVATLVLPRLVALLISLPILVFFSIILAIVGGMITTVSLVGITGQQFITQFASSITITTFWVGMSKSPIFAIIIAMVGCYRGLQVTRSAISVGQMTTRSVVESLFLVIVADALISLLYSYLGV